MTAIDRPAVSVQPDPVHQPKEASVWSMVVADMKDREQFGFEKYGTHLKVGNGRDHLLDAYQEVLDLSVYIRQQMEARKRLKAAVREALEEKFSTLRKDGNGLTLTQEFEVLAAATSAVL